MHDRAITMKDRRARTSFPLILTLCAAAACAAAACAPERRAGLTPATPPPAQGGGAAAARVPLYTDLGSHHHPVSTSSPLAQRYFDQGLTLAYGFNHEEAMRSFEEAARLDPGMAMAHWGVALTLGTNINRPADPARNRLAFEAIQRARALAPRASAAERAYIEALAPRYTASAKVDQAALNGAYADAMRELARRYPGDMDAATLYAEAMMNLRPWDYWTPDGQPQPGTPGIIATLEEVLRRAPDHIGAVVTQSYAGNDSSHLWEVGIPVCLYGVQSGRDEKGEPDTFVYVSSLLRVTQTYAVAALNWCNQLR